MFGETDSFIADKRFTNNIAQGGKAHRLAHFARSAQSQAYGIGKSWLMIPV